MSGEMEPTEVNANRFAAVAGGSLSLDGGHNLRDSPPG
jgi:hypothetical protein